MGRVAAKAPNDMPPANLPETLRPTAAAARQRGGCACTTTKDPTEAAKSTDPVPRTWKNPEGVELISSFFQIFRLSHVRHMRFTWL